MSNLRHLELAKWVHVWQLGVGAQFHIDCDCRLTIADKGDGRTVAVRLLYACEGRRKKDGSWQACTFGGKFTVGKTNRLTLGTYCRPVDPLTAALEEAFG